MDIDYNAAMIQAEIYCVAKAAGFDVQLEVEFPSKHHRSHFMRIDALLIHDGWPVVAIEAKREGYRGTGHVGRQRRAYEDLPFPYEYVASRDEVQQAVSKYARTIRRA